MKSLIPDQINSALDSIVTKCFEGNRIADRGMSILSVKFAMNNAEKLLHPKLAHLFPQLADVVSGFQDSRGALTAYGLTPEDVTDYESPLDFFIRILDYCQDLEGLVSEAIEISSSSDMITYAFLIKFLRQVSDVTAQCILLVDKAEIYGNDHMAFDHRIEDFIIL